MTPQQLWTFPSKAAKAAGLLLALLVAAPAAAGPYASLDGAWRGTGSVTLAGGQSEKLTCKAYYRAKDEGETLGIALQCASPSNKIDLRANLVFNGDAVTGTWEERAFNSSGAITGTSTPGQIDLSISGTLQAKMSIAITPAAQSVSISTDGTGFQSVDLQLARN
jgi:hypothetical protein